MVKRSGCALVILTAFCLILGASAQTPPCSTGRLDNVLGTSCSVGAITFNFQTSFNGSFVAFDQGVLANRGTITPAEIGFTPINSKNVVGFKLTTNFIDGPGPDSSFSSFHNITFSYTTRANPGFDIVGEIVHIDSTLQGGSTDSASESVIDFQDYPNILSTSPNPGLSLQSGKMTSHLTDPVYLPAPALFSDGFPGHPEIQTTFINGSTTGSADATLASVTFLYNAGSMGPLPAASLTYSTIDLPGVASTLVSGITNAGKMVGAYQDVHGVFHAYVTDERSGFVTIDFPNATATFGNGLNDRGDLVGSYMDASGNSHGFLLQGEDFISFDFPGAIFTDAIAINDNRQVVGLYETADQGIHGFLFDDGRFISIDHSDPDMSPFIFGPPFTEIFGINNRSEIAGFFFDPFTFRGLVQQRNLTQVVDVPGQTPTIIESLNDEGTLIGNYNDVNLILHGFVHRGDLFQTVDFPNGNTTLPLGINGAGKIVGQYSDAAGHVHSFMAEPHNNDENEQNAVAGKGDSAGHSGAAPAEPTPLRTCGSTEWQQHPEQIRFNCKMTSAAVFP